MEEPAWIALLQSSKGTWSEKGDVKIRGMLFTRILKDATKEM